VVSDERRAQRPVISDCRAATPTQQIAALTQNRASTGQACRKVADVGGADGGEIGSS
jgi:hypothetical protein